MGQSNSKIHLNNQCSDISSIYDKNRIKIEKIDVSIEKKPVLIDEGSPSVLKYKTPHFRASATVKFPPIATNQIWKLGWIQACTKMEFFNVYGEFGYSSWEIPELLSGEKPMVSDSDGKNFPFYGNKNEVEVIIGPKATSTLHQVMMTDNFCPHVTWDLPINQQRHVRLTKVKRNQKFITWLVAMNMQNSTFIVLKTYKWSIKLEIDVNPLSELGSRAKLVSDQEQKQPRELKKNLKIPNCALYPSNANGCQRLIWHSSKISEPLIVISSKLARV